MRAASAFPSRILADIAGRIAWPGGGTRAAGRAAQPGNAFARRRPCNGRSFIFPALPVWAPWTAPATSTSTQSSRQPCPPQRSPSSRRGAPQRVAAPQVMMGHPLDRIVAGANRLFALSGGEVRTFDGDGQTLGRCAGFAPPPPKGRRAAPGGVDAEEALRAAGLPDDDSTPEAEEALEDEGLGPKRRTRPQPQADGGILPHAIAASETSDAVWIATSSGVYRGDENGCLPAGLDGRDLLLVGAAGGALVAATDNLLFMRAPSSTATVRRRRGRDLHRRGGADRAAAGAGARRRWCGDRRGRRRRPGDRRRRERPRESSIARPTRWRSAAASPSRSPMTASTAGRPAHHPCGSPTGRRSGESPVGPPEERALDRERPRRLDLARRDDLDGADRDAGAEGARGRDRGPARVAGHRQRAGRVRPDRRGAGTGPLVGTSIDRLTRADRGRFCAAPDAPSRAPRPPLARGHRSLRRRAHARSPQLAGR